MRIETLNTQTQNETFVLYSEYEDRHMPAKHFWKWNGNNWTTSRTDFLINFLNKYHDFVKCDKRSEWLYQNENEIILFEMFNCLSNKVVLPDWAVNLMGCFDNKKRYLIHKIYTTSYSNSIRYPSASYPFSRYKHILTHKYLKQYFAEFPAKLREAKLLALDQEFIKNLKIRKQRVRKIVRVAA